MGLPARLGAGSHVLFLADSMIERLSLVEWLLANVARRGRRLVAIVDPGMRAVFDAAVDLQRLRTRQAVVRTIDESIGPEGGWQKVCELISRLVEEVEGAASAWRRDEPETETLVFVDLDSVFSRCAAASEMMSVVYALRDQHAANRRSVVEAVSVSMLPRSLPAEFFGLHTDWAVASHTTEGIADGATIDAASQRVALETAQFRHQFLALAKNDRAGALSLVPRLFFDYRRGFLLIDETLRIRYCTARAAHLLGRGSDEILGRPINACIDGVDLVTLKHECARTAGGTQSPFVVSWRLAPGAYEPREVTVDPLTSANQTVGFIVSLGLVETVRGPRAAYRQLAEETPPSAPATGSDESDIEESLSESLHGTQITRREHEVLLLVLRDASNRDIAQRLNVAEVTVKKHLTSIYRKLRITNRAELIQSFASPHSDGASTYRDLE